MSAHDTNKHSVASSPAASGSAVPLLSAEAAAWLARHHHARYSNEVWHSALEAIARGRAIVVPASGASAGEDEILALAYKVVEAHMQNTGCEPSLSAFHRAVDELVAAARLHRESNK